MYQLVDLEIDNFLLSVRPYSDSDKLIIQEIWSNTDSYKINGKKNDVVVDIGGNIGLFSLWIKRNNPDARVIAYEPECENIEIFRKNIEQNQINIELVHKAVSDFNGVVYLDGNHGLTSTNKQGGTQSIPCTTINELFKEHNLLNVDILKVDVEGAEYEIFSCIEDDVLKSIQYITMEVHYINEEKLTDLLSVLSRHHDMVYEPSDFQPPRGGMLYASRKST